MRSGGSWALGGGWEVERIGENELGWNGEGWEGSKEGGLSGRGHPSRQVGGGLTLMLMNPSTFDSSPRRADSREDFPAPTGPTTASRQPWGTVRFILATQEGRHDMTLVRVRPASVRKDEAQMEPGFPALRVSKRTCGDRSFSQSLSSYSSNHPVHISACTHAHTHTKRAHMHAHLHTQTSMLACTATHTMWAHIHTHTHKSMHIPNQSMLTHIQVCTHAHHAHTGTPCTHMHTMHTHACMSTHIQTHTELTIA